MNKQFADASLRWSGLSSGVINIPNDETQRRQGAKDFIFCSELPVFWN